jgi:hypothetical protein
MRKRQSYPHHKEWAISPLLCKNEEKAQDLNNWRPISLLNTDYKIISKTICNRLKMIAHEIIGPEQTCGIIRQNYFRQLALYT